VTISQGKRPKLAGFLLPGRELESRTSWDLLMIEEQFGNDAKNGLSSERPQEIDDFLLLSRG